MFTPLVGSLGIGPSLLMLIQVAALLKQACLTAGCDDGLQQAAVIVVVGMCQHCLCIHRTAAWYACLHVESVAYWQCCSLSM